MTPNIPVISVSYKVFRVFQGMEIEKKPLISNQITMDESDRVVAELTAKDICKWPSEKVIGIWFKIEVPKNSYGIEATISKTNHPTIVLTLEPTAGRRREKRSIRTHCSQSLNPNNCCLQDLIASFSFNISQTKCSDRLREVKMEFHPGSQDF